MVNRMADGTPADRRTPEQGEVPAPAGAIIQEVFDPR